MVDKKVEKIANAIKFMVPLNCDSVTLNGDALMSWTELGLATLKWPESFSKQERKLLRHIAKTALEASK